MSKSYKERLRDHERFHVRDIDTKEVKEKFRGRYSAQRFIESMHFGLGRFYEVYDTRNKKSLFLGKGGRIGRNVK